MGTWVWERAGERCPARGFVAATLMFVVLVASAAGCRAPGQSAPLGEAGEQQRPAGLMPEARRVMVDDQIEARGIRDPRVLAAMRKVPRERFVPPDVASLAYADQPLPIGHGQTISQPYIVAYMSEALQITERSKVLEIGTGSGYQAAILGELAREVYTIELIPALAERARETLANLGYTNVHVRAGDGYLGWPDEAPFDAIMVTAAPDHVPQPLVDQLAIGGRLVIPVGDLDQDMRILTRTAAGVQETVTIPVRFVPLRRGGQN
jgi:protein-L-isoaspartate(D-aspartate) O-methyltransferase